MSSGTRTSRSASSATAKWLRRAAAQRAPHVCHTLPNSCLTRSHCCTKDHPTARSERIPASMLHQAKVPMLPSLCAAAGLFTAAEAPLPLPPGAQRHAVTHGHQAEGDAFVLQQKVVQLLQRRRVLVRLSRAGGKAKVGGGKQGGPAGKRFRGSGVSLNSHVCMSNKSSSRPGTQSSTEEQHNGQHHTAHTSAGRAAQPYHPQHGRRHAHFTNRAQHNHQQQGASKTGSSNSC